MSRAGFVLAALAAAALGLSGCGDEPPGGGEGRLTVAATTTIWGSIADQLVACAGTGTSTGTSKTLMPPGADPHDYAASSTDVAAMVGADLVVANGLGLEQGLASAMASAAADGANILEVAPQLDPVPFNGGEAGGSEHAGAGDDPHVWQDMSRGAKAAGLIGDRLAQATGDDAYTTCGRTVADDIALAERDVITALSPIPSQDRILVTDHDALGYFALAYDFTVAGVVIPGGSTLAQPSSAELAELTATIKEAGVPAIFSNTASPTDLSEAVAGEVGDIEVVPLFVDSVGEPGTQAETYQGMMRSNAAAIANALT